MSDARVLLVVFLIALLIPLVTIFLRLSRNLLGMMRASVQISMGRYAQARAYLEGAVKRRPSWFGLTPSLHRACTFHLAVCDFEEGRLDDAAARLRAITTRDGVMGDAVLALLAATLLVADEEPSEARPHLERIVGRRGSPNIVLLLSHALLSEGDEEAARAMFATVDDVTGRRRRPLAWGGFLRFDSLTRAPFTEAFLRGWFLLRTGQAELAEPLLRRATQCRVPNRFSTMATVIQPAQAPVNAPAASVRA